MYAKVHVAEGQRAGWDEQTFLWSRMQWHSELTNWVKVNTERTETHMDPAVCVYVFEVLKSDMFKCTSEVSFDVGFCIWLESLLCHRVGSDFACFSHPCSFSLSNKQDYFFFFLFFFFFTFLDSLNHLQHIIVLQISGGFILNNCKCEWVSDCCAIKAEV